MKDLRLQKIIFWALCCALGLFCKRLVAPAANIITNWLHIPGGIGTSFSLMFLAVAGILMPHPRCCTIMAAVQSMLALSLGMVGSMGALSPIGYIFPGIVMDLVFWGAAKARLSQADALVAANALGAVCAALTANLIVFRLWGFGLLLYLCVAATAGMLFGLLGGRLVKKLRPAIRIYTEKEGNVYENI